MKKLFFTAIALIAFSGVSMASSVEVEKLNFNISVIDHNCQLVAKVNAPLPYSAIEALFKECAKVAQKTYIAAAMSTDVNVSSFASNIADVTFNTCVFGM